MVDTLIMKITAKLGNVCGVGGGREGIVAETSGVGGGRVQSLE